MPGSFVEMNRKVSVSIGLLITIVMATFIVASFYLEVRSMREDFEYYKIFSEEERQVLKQRMDKRYYRHEESIEELHSEGDIIKDRIRELETCNH